jgi:uncharacterized protein
VTDEHTKELAEYRLQQARETLQEAEGLYSMSLWRGTINRAYYAMFYAVLALTVLRQQVTSVRPQNKWDKKVCLLRDTFPVVS